MSAAAFRFAALVPLLALAACGHKTPDQTASPTVEGASPAEVATDWTAQNPTDPAVPVTLPTTQMTNNGVQATGAPGK